MVRSETGFTLIELLVVVAIIGVLAAIAIPQFSAYRLRGYNASAHSTGKNVATAEEAFFSVNYSYLQLPLQQGPKQSDSVGDGSGTILVGSQLAKDVSVEVSTSGNGVTGSFYTAGLSHLLGDRVVYFESEEGTWKYRFKSAGVAQTDAAVTAATSNIDIIPDAML